jgi:hypothetical protein
MKKKKSILGVESGSFDETDKMNNAFLKQILKVSQRKYIEAMEISASQSSAWMT